MHPRMCTSVLHQVKLTHISNYLITLTDQHRANETEIHDANQFKLDLEGGAATETLYSLNYL